MEKITEHRKYSGKYRKVLGDIYKTCEAKRVERILWIIIDFSVKPTAIDLDSYALNGFVISLIDLADNLSEIIIVDILKKFSNALHLDDQKKATIVQIIDKHGNECAFIAEVDMTLENFVEDVSEYFFSN